MFLCAMVRVRWCVLCVDRFESLLVQYQNIRYHVMHVVSERLKVSWLLFSVAVFTLWVVAVVGGSQPRLIRSVWCEPTIIGAGVAEV